MSADIQVCMVMAPDYLSCFCMLLTFVPGHPVMFTVLQDQFWTAFLQVFWTDCLE